MARMVASKTNLGTGGRAKRRKKAPEEIAEERIEAAHASGVAASRQSAAIWPEAIGGFHQKAATPNSGLDLGGRRREDGAHGRQ
jgi:hypothetical protein